jgi:hypothetical protein
MIRSSPCDHYLRYLITHPDQYEDASIRNLVKLQHLDFVGMDHLKRLRASCAVPVPFYPEDLTHHESQRFLNKERIFQLYHPDADMTSAIKLLDHPRGKETTESLLAVGAEPLWICSMLKRMQLHLTTRTIELYRHFYFNTSLVNSVELQTILSMRADIDVPSGDSDARSYRYHYGRAMKDSVSSLLSTTTLSPFGHILNMMRLGVMPQGVEISKLATSARMSAVLLSQQNIMLGKAEKARDFALTAKIMNELMESVGDVSGDLQKSLMKLSLDTDASVVPQLSQLSAGNHTVDYLPVMDVGPEGVEVTSDG